MSIKDYFSDKIAAISTPSESNLLSISNFTRFSDNSAVLFKLDCKGDHFQVSSFSFFADTNIFKRFLPDLKKSYQSLSGIAKIETSYEDDVLKIKFKDNGHIDILCNVFIHDEYSQVVNIGFELDQSYLPSFIESLEKIYEELFP
ncbi:WapI family immunity protein [Leptospira licerasiae]|uniref:WapI family immunity protein n=1 Tax=Leptospira licerasiae TaxID=447106 RepID=UPI00024888C2|nr:hypothetical protein [Leptospira licerasiae]EIE00975.1 hypothetical protein LEP1GSC185_3878 [Leptospira licerasiae serovar Varillal str. VAR 010]